MTKYTNLLVTVSVLVSLLGCTPKSYVRLRNATSAPITITVAFQNSKRRPSTYVWQIEPGDWAEINSWWGANMSIRVTNAVTVWDYRIEREKVDDWIEEWRSGVRSEKYAGYEWVVPIQFSEDGAFLPDWPTDREFIFEPARAYEIEEVGVEEGCWTSGAWSSNADSEGAQERNGQCWGESPFVWTVNSVGCAIHAGLVSTREVIWLGSLLPVWGHDTWKRESSKAWHDVNLRCRWLWLNGGNGIPLRTGSPNPPLETQNPAEQAFGTSADD